MPLALYIDITYTRPPDVAARKWSDFAKAGNAAVAERWHENYLPSHFAEHAKTKYNYARRAASTLARKARMAKRGQAMHGGRRLLVEKGLLREQVSRRGILRVYPTRFTLKMPSHVPRRPKNSSIDLHEEVTRTTSGERRMLAKLWKKVVLKHLENYRPRRRVSSRL